MHDKPGGVFVPCLRVGSQPRPFRAAVSAKTTPMCSQVTEKESKEIMSKVLSLIEDEASCPFNPSCIPVPPRYDAGPQYQQIFHTDAAGERGQQGHFYRVRSFPSYNRQVTSDLRSVLRHHTHTPCSQHRSSWWHIGNLPLASHASSAKASALTQAAAQ